MLNCSLFLWFNIISRLSVCKFDINLVTRIQFRSSSCVCLHEIFNLLMCLHCLASLNVFPILESRYYDRFIRLYLFDRKIWVFWIGRNIQLFCILKIFRNCPYFTSLLNLVSRVISGGFTRHHIFFLVSCFDLWSHSLYSWRFHLFRSECLGISLCHCWVWFACRFVFHPVHFRWVCFFNFTDIWFG